MNNNQNLKHIARGLSLGKHDIVEIMHLGGIEISKTRADGFQRGSESRKKPDPGSHNPLNQERRIKTMTDDEFSAFCAGLEIWLKTNA